MTDSKHSTLPWERQDDKNSNYGATIVTASKVKAKKVACRVGGPDRDANAALIVRAVNAHDKLVAAIEQVLQDDREFRCCSSTTLEDIETVLASLKEPE